ncbi:MAG: AMP-binding protein [Alphaproteobacteria bacterium]|nr:AMP-binding protein [Alphaproteobacteria bacterium]
MTHDTIPRRLRERARVDAQHPAYQVRQPDGSWSATTWAAYAAEVQAAAKSLLALGVEPGEGVCMLGYNRPEWVIVDVAAMTVGAMPAGIYTTCSPEEVAYIVGHCDARVVLVEDLGQLAKLQETKDQLPKLERVVLMKGVQSDDPLALAWEDFVSLGSSVPDADVDARLDALQPDAVGTLIYTSGTTGPPKAVMLTHHNLTHTADVAVDMVGATASDRMISYLPLSHIAEQMFTVHGPISSGLTIWYAESMETLLRDLQAARPTILFGVPRVWEKMHAGLTARMAQATGAKAVIATWATGIGRKAVDVRNAGGTPGGLLALQYRLADRLVFSKVKAALGLDAARFGISGAAPIAKEVLEFFAGLDIVIHEVYGQSEGTGPTTFNRPGQTKFGTVGPAIPGTEVRIADDGEICLRGGNVFAGYLKEPAATAETLIDGWLHSGDLGSIDADGFLSITGRKKEILITAGGKNIAPKNIEAALKNLPLVSQAVVIGDRRKFLSALLTLDPEATQAFAQEHGLPTDGIHARPELIAALQAGVDAEVNPRFARVEHVRKFSVLPRDLTIADGELTPTLKIKRRVVDQHFADVIEAMYAEG